MTDKSRQRWFRFSLRTLFVLVTILCCWLGWESSVVRGRQKALGELRANPAYRVTMADDWIKSWAGISASTPAKKVSAVRVLLGDKAIQEIAYYPHSPRFTKSELDRLKGIFPEASVVEDVPLMEPCHPGCFPSGTLVETPDGRRRIENIRPGDFVTSILPSGESRAIEVQSVFITENILWRIATDRGELLTTETQPLCQSIDQFQPAGKLQPGDTILCREAGDIQGAKVLSASATGRGEKVFNLILGDCEIFVAGGFLARSKPPKPSAE